MDAEQTARQRNLALANTVRLGRAEIKRQVKRGERDPRRILKDPPELIVGMKMAEFLGCCPAIGKIKTQKIMRMNRIAPHSRVGDVPADVRVRVGACLPR